MSKWQFWRVQRAWAQGSLQHACFWLGMGLSFVALGALGWRLQAQQRERLTLSSASWTERHSGPPVNVNSDASLIAGLPALAEGREILKFVEAAASLAGVQLASVRLDKRSTASGDLGEMAFAIEMRGSYGATKEALRKLLLQVPNATLSSFRFARATADGQVGTSLQLTVWTAPSATETRR